MSASHEFRPWAIVDPNHRASLVGALRQRRWREFAARFPDLGGMSVLDLGGTPRAWSAAPVAPARLVILNTEPSGRDGGVDAEVIVGDACDPPGRLEREQFDLVFSNSVIEHVGGHVRRQRFASTVRSFAVHHWIQTPYRYFPIEPHFLWPGYQFLPLLTRTRVARSWGPARRSIRAMNFSDAVDFVQAIELLSITDMRSYFPESELLRERVAGLVKSVVAVS